MHIFIYIIGFFWIAANIVRLSLLRFASPDALDRLRTRYGIQLGLVSITCTTQYFNRHFNHFEAKRRLAPRLYRLYTKYFSISVWIALVSIPFALFLIIRSLFSSNEFAYLIAQIFDHHRKNIHDDDDDDGGSLRLSHIANEPIVSNSDSALTLIIPGVNISSQECVYFFAAIIIASVIHELGHALAANRHKLAIYDVGFSVFLFIPAVFVTIDSNREIKRGPFGQLEIVTAGLINNLLLCVAAVAFFVANPLKLFYHSVDGLAVIDVNHLSSVSMGQNGLSPDDIIKSINGMHLATVEQWTHQLHSIASHQIGFCISANFIQSKSNDNKLIRKLISPCDLDNCCQSTAGSDICFLAQIDAVPLKSIENEEDDDEKRKCRKYSPLSSGNLPKSFANITTSSGENDFHKSYRNVCLPARRVTEIATTFCDPIGAFCPETYYGAQICVWPHSGERSTRLISLERTRFAEDKPNIVFWGPPAELYQAIKLSERAPSFRLLPLAALEQSSIFLRYLFTISFSVFLFNLLPFEPMDGFQLVQLSGALFISNQRTRDRVLRLAHFAAICVIVLGALVVTLQLRRILYQTRVGKEWH